MTITPMRQGNGIWLRLNKHHLQVLTIIRRIQKGFDQYYGFIEDSSDQYRPDLTIDNTQIPSPTNQNYHFSEAIVENANRYVTNQTSVHPDKPFFLYLTFGAQHSPHQVPQEYIDRYKGAYDKGWDQIRQERFERQKQLGIIPEDAQLAPRNQGSNRGMS